MSKPLILVTNDDGVFAPGIQALIGAVKTIGEVVVVAPDSPQSGMGHAVTLTKPIRLKSVDYYDGISAWACSGTPVDCVKLAVDKLLPRKPDLCVSGINHGSNSSVNILYSGTMSAAVEAALEGIPAIGFSLCDYSHEADMSKAATYANKVSQMLLKHGLPEGTLLNVNIPGPNDGDIKGIKICRQANAKWMEEFVERDDPHGKKYYWLTGKFVNGDKGEGTDEWALNNGYVSVVPVQFDLTAHHGINFINQNWDVNE